MSGSNRSTALPAHDFPVATNWDASLNEGRGGPRPGGTDGIGEVRLNGGAVEAVLPLQDDDSGNPYLYRTEKYALFAGEPGGERMRAPAYECYIGETYSLYRVTEEVVRKLSDDCLAATRYPAVVRRFDTGANELADVPAFQLVHGCVVGEGQHRSMATFILPPYWRPDSVQGYTALFSGFYDQNENVFGSVGPPLLKALGDSLKSTGRGSVGIVWNGGGSIGTRTLQGSIYGNLNDLFAEANRRFRVDPHAIVAVGGSRGAIAGLVAAGNPQRSGYSIPYLVCYNPPLFFGDDPSELLNPAFPVRWDAVRGDIGYKEAWRPGWTGPDGESAIERFLTLQFGTADRDLIVQELGPASDRLLQGLKDSGTKVCLNHGTHDAFTPSWPAFEWAERARRRGVPVRHEIGYRFGHNNCTDPYARAAECLAALVKGEELLAEGTWHYCRASEAADEWALSERFEPTVQPAFLEVPKAVIPGFPIYLAVYGSAGMAYSVEVLEKREETWGEAFVLAAGVLSKRDGFAHDGSYRKIMMNVPDRLIPGTYAYRFRYRREGEAAWSEARLLPHPGEEGPAVWEVLSDIPNFTDAAWLERTMRHAIGWGLSER
ncbi:hypothetical protein [Cohnella phaseoli]|uniref:Uncharacterized protein n=1 Tax=Cohnella phaseoli TaxID=456490 RepID=A0A3D9KGY9_9BACL|nr:hypothetical protein [Cohnella phaseoli]RED85560.1 hypothetical protein DFP98_104265 [Cohnella phaseoli]